MSASNPLPRSYVGAPMQVGSLSDPVDDVPFAIEPIVAWRAWRTAWMTWRSGDGSAAERRYRRDPLLYSLTCRTLWPVRRPMRAHCLSQIFQSPGRLPRPYHSSPDPQHHCGIVAVRERDYAMTWVGPRGFVGRVLLWGRVLCYEQGYLAEYAYPLSIEHARSDEQTPQELEETVAILAERYGLEVCL